MKSFDLASKVAIVDDAALNGEVRLIFPILATAIIVFVATAAVTFVNIGFHPHATFKAFNSVVGSSESSGRSAAFYLQRRTRQVLLEQIE